MGKLISPDPDMWKNPVRRGAVEERLQDVKKTTYCDRRRSVITAMVVVALLFPFIVIVFKLLLS